ncbi:sulfotransferase family protein [Aspergillus puulaauensis]|uniref:NAD dependent epimerase/dehydratase n=1 Tax=Aspergillus puulaauensis TaxID=1220207 RepID=A0A7R7XM45_9EURO|nr:uncharacterized protein APUU_40494A [Aspergillus puulaauensis]BCS24050.1 hypothetical protein APUU_40494A [Aspergillus puulaauensis]
MAANAPFPAADHPMMKPPFRRKKPMQVLALGMSRTGTLSLYTALNELGYNCYHMTECCLDFRNDSLLYWNKAIDVKRRGYGRELKRRHFDLMLWRYDAVTDFPCTLFVEELMDVYPDAKIILTTRDLESWVSSMQHSLYAILRMKRLKLLALFDWKYTRPVLKLIRSALTIWTDGVPKDPDHLIAGYVAHKAHVRGAALQRKREVFEFSVKDGWRPLCDFLGKEVPTKPFPRVNEGSFIAQYLKLMFWKRVVELGAPILVAACVSWVMNGVFWWWVLPM